MQGSARILVVEDDPTLREAIVEQLADHGYEVDAAANGAVGLEKALIRRPDVVLFDFAMPVTDGPTLVEELRTLLTPLPVLVAISGRNVAKQWCAENGVAAFLRKPFGDTTLQRVVVSVVDRLARESTAPPPPDRTSIRSACVLAVGDMDEASLRRELPHSLKHARIVILVDHHEAERVLDHVLPELLVVRITDEHARLRSIATERGIPMLPLESL